MPEKLIIALFYYVATRTLTRAKSACNNPIVTVQTHRLVLFRPVTRISEGGVQLYLIDDHSSWGLRPQLLTTIYYLMPSNHLKLEV